MTADMIAVNPRTLVTRRRLDLAVKWRFFKDVDDIQALKNYKDHILFRNGERMFAGAVTDGWKKNLDDYVNAALSLRSSMAAGGYDAKFPIPVDPKGELLGGAHRVACALALNINHVAVCPQTRHAWAPDWGSEWFATRFPEPEYYRILKDWMSLREVRECEPST
jgi:hypothetical protein